MQTNRITKAFWIVSVGICLVVGLYIYQSFRPVHKNGFFRKIEENIVSVAAEEWLDDYGYYIAGFSLDSLYLGNYQLTNRVLVTDTKFQHRHLYRIKLPTPLAWSLVEFSVYHERLYVVDRGTSMIIEISLPSMDSLRIYHMRTGFADAWALPNQKFILRTTDSVSQQFKLKILSGKSKLIVSSGLLQRQDDGFFSVDGMLMRTDSDQFVYTYFYRNQVLLADSNLTLVKSFHTIDTFSHSPNQIRTVEKTGLSTFVNPPIFVNKKSVLFRNRLLILSGLRADNQKTRDFNLNATIDVYSLTQGKYVYSFYIPLNGHKSVTSLASDGRYIYAIFADKYFAKYLIDIASPTNPDL